MENAWGKVSYFGPLVSDSSCTISSSQRVNLTRWLVKTFYRSIHWISMLKPNSKFFVVDISTFLYTFKKGGKENFFPLFVLEHKYANVVTVNQSQCILQRNMLFYVCIVGIFYWFSTDSISFCYNANFSFLGKFQRNN